MMYMSAPEQAERGGTLAARAGLIALMLVGSLALWLGDPVLWLWITSRLQSTQATMGPYALMLVGITLTAVAVGKGLSRPHPPYAGGAGPPPPGRGIPPG